MLDFICALPVIAGLFSACNPGPPLAVGYVEGEFLSLSPYETGKIETVSAVRGARVRKGQVIFTMETDDARLALLSARAKLAQARARLANLTKGRRPEEIDVIKAQLKSAEAQLKLSEIEFNRQSRLRERGVVSAAKYDEAKTRTDLARARVEELKAQLAVARLPARAYEIEAARRQVEEAKAQVDTSKWRLDHRIAVSPADGVVNDVIRRRGETAGPAQPVVSILPDGAVKLKIYVAQKYLSQLKPDSVIKVRCDGCPAGLGARISYISPEPEYTPPVIYSLEVRQKLVYLIEARPTPDSASVLKPGQIVDAILDGQGK